MKWESKVANEMLSGLCVLKNTPSWMAPLAVLLVFSSYQLMGFRPFSVLFKLLAVLISNLLYIWKHNQVPANKLVVEEIVSNSEEDNSDETENTELVPTPMRMNETVTQAKETQEEKDTDDAASATHSAISANKLSESECHDKLSTSENSDDLP